MISKSNTLSTYATSGKTSAFMRAIIVPTRVSASASHLLYALQLSSNVVKSHLLLPVIFRTIFGSSRLRMGHESM